MKTAVSIPDPIFAKADRYARRVKKSRSRVFSEALREYLARHSPDEVTEAMDQALEALDEPRDQFVAKASEQILRHVEW